MKLASLKATPRSAYILLEVMLATAIFAMAAVSLVIVLNEAFSAGLRVQRETRIVWDLESRLNLLRTERLAPGTETSKPDADGVIYKQEVNLLNLKNEKNLSLAGMYDIKITAMWKEENRDVEQVAQIYVYQQ